MESTVFIYRNGALGDTVAFIPFVFELRKYYKKIVFAGNYLYRQLFEDIDFVDFIDANSKDVLNIFIGKPFPKADKYLIFSKNSYGLERSELYFFEPLPESGWFYKHPFDCLGLAFKEEAVYLPISYDESIASVIGKKPFLIFHPGSGGRKKRWPIDDFFALETFVKKEFDFEVFYILGEAEEEEELIKRVGNKKCLVNLTLKKVIFLLSRSCGFVGCDSGISHLTGILNLCGVAVFGPSSPDIFKPYGDVKVVKGETENIESVNTLNVIKVLGEELEKRRNLPCV
ncbi:MAG: glycosyltransferase family 9 protein [bacterium]